MTENNDDRFFDDDDNNDDGLLFGDIQAYSHIDPVDEQSSKGRPRKPKSETLSVVRKFRITEGDAETLKNLATRAGMSEADYIRFAIFHTHDNKKRRVPNDKELHLLGVAFKRPTDLLNQALKYMHTHNHGITDEAIDKLVGSLVDLKKVQQQYEQQVREVLRDYKQ